MKIIGKVKPADIPENQTGKASKRNLLTPYSPDGRPKKRIGKYMELWRQIAALAPGEVLKIENDYESRPSQIRDNVKKQFKHGKYEVIARTVNGTQYAYIHYNREV